MATSKKEKELNHPEDKEKALTLLLQSIDKQHGKGAVIGGDLSGFSTIERIPSGSLMLDHALGGGYARGRIIELTGMESSGKTSTCLHAITEAQKMGDTCAFVDAEHSLDIEYAKNIGVDTSRLLISQPDSGEQALQIIDMMVRSGAVGLIVVDSVAALVPKSEIDGQIGDSNIGTQARLLSQAMRMLVGPVSKTNTTIIFINQIRSKVGVVYGSPEVSCGGNSLKYYSSQRLDIRKVGVIEVGEEKTGITSRVKITKNKVGPPFRVAEFNIMFGRGIDWQLDLLTAAIETGVVEKAGSWISFEGEKWQGIQNAGMALENNPELVQRIKEKVVAIHE